MPKPLSEPFNESIKSEEKANPGWQPFGNRRPSLISPSTSEVNDPLARLQDYAFPPAQRNSAINTASGNDYWPSPHPPWSLNNSPQQDYPDIASVPMLPECSVEPFYREQRSMSYSFGAYDWPHKNQFQQQQRSQLQQHYNNISNSSGGGLFTPTHSTSLLDTMHEEENEEEMDLLRARVRSKSSAAVMDIWSPLKDNTFSRRLSLTPIPMPPPPILPTTSPLYTPQMSAGDRERIRRFSLTPLTLDTHHSPFTTNNNAKNLLAQRRHSLAGPAANISTMDTLAETVESLAVQTMDEKEEEEEGMPNVDDMGKGVKLESDLLSNVLFYVIEFKGGRSDIFYSSIGYKQGDLVMVEADRGRDLGKISVENIHRVQVETFYRNNRNMEEEPLDNKKQEIFIKRIFRQARPDEITLLLAKGQDESKALVVCQSKIKQKKLCMQVVDAEYQWDRRKLTFYFVAEKRVDFRELVRELFKLYKTRIWMCTINSIKMFKKIDAAL